MDDRHDEVFKALADPSRRRIVAALCNEPMVAGDLGRLVSLAPNAVSFHLRLLQEAKLVSVQRQGRFLWYRVDQEVLEEWRRYSHDLFSVSPDAASIEAHVTRPPQYPPPEQLRMSSAPDAESSKAPAEAASPAEQSPPVESEEKLPDELL